MCKLVPVLRVIGFVFLVIAIVALLVGFVSPFWIHLPPDAGHEGTTTALPGVELMPQPVAVAEETTETPTQSAATTPAASSMLGLGEKLSGLLKNGSYHGLWAKCFQNFSCSCFWQDDFAMEKAFPGIEGLNCEEIAGLIIWLLKSVYSDANRVSVLHIAGQRNSS